MEEGVARGKAKEGNKGGSRALTFMAKSADSIPLEKSGVL